VGSDRLGDDGPVPTDPYRMVDAYWRYHQLSQGTRQERLASEAYFWAWDALSTAVMESPLEAIDMIDAVLRHPDADHVYVGAGPIEDLLADGRQSPDLVEEIGLRCREDPLWREAVSHAYVADPVPAPVALYVLRPRAASPPSNQVAPLPLRAGRDRSGHERLVTMGSESRLKTNRLVYLFVGLVTVMGCSVWSGTTRSCR
jgi:hypothetical protein